ncbi:MAG: hypothetical protein ACU843_03770 [Gammaproteobacteria bacterium]
MLKKKSLLAVILVFLFGIWGSAFALEGEYTTPSPEDNKKLLDAGIEHTEAAIASAKAGDAAAAAEHAQAASAQLGEINSEAWGGPLEGAKSKIRVGGIKVKKGDTENGIKMMEEALAKLKKL